MALSSGIYGQTLLDCFDGSDQILDYANDTINVWLLEDTATPDFDAATSALADIVAGDRVTGTGTFSQALGTKSVSTTLTANFLSFDAADSAFTTLTTDSPHINGCVIYDDTLATPQVDPMLCIVDFVTNYPVTAGNFTITWAATGIFRISLT
jgi:hypothetical protein